MPIPLQGEAVVSSIHEIRTEDGLLHYSILNKPVSRLLCPDMQKIHGWGTAVEYSRIFSLPGWKSA
jgi:hypothetical protein